MEEVDDPKDYENIQTKPVLDPFKSTAPHRKVRELPRKMNIEEVEEAETMKIYRQNPFTPVWATRKLWTFTRETNMQARNHENSDEIRPTPVRHLDLATPAFTITVRTPSVTTLFGEKTSLIQSAVLKFSNFLRSTFWGHGLNAPRAVELEAWQPGRFVREAEGLRYP